LQAGFRRARFKRHAAFINQTFFTKALAGASALLLAFLMLAGIFSASLQAQSGITSPAAGSTIGGDVPVIGTADIDTFSKYELHYKVEPSGDDAFIYFDGGTSPVQNGQLGTWRAAGLAAGVYTLRLRVVRSDGNYQEFYAPNLSVNQGPTPTPTSALPSPTPTSDQPTATFTPAPSATPNVGAVQQPQIETPAPPTVDLAALPAPATAAPGETVVVQPGDLAADAASAATVVATAPASETSSLSRSLGEALSMDRLRGEFGRGMRLSASIALVAIGLYLAKRIFDWARRRFG
jgi:hypothetical protein